jgi:aminoglycoside phosphotransferase (APT) family kinase protein
MLEKAADPARVGRWLAERLSDSGWLDCQLRVVGHGRSNLTFRVDSAAGAVVLRHPPVGSVAATAHDMGRERRVMSAPAGTDVPVPGVLAWSEGVEPSDPVDAPCYVMELVDGIVPLVTPPPNWAGPAERTASAHALVDVLAGVLARARAGAMPPSAAEGLSEGIPPLVAVGHHVLAEGLA